MEEKDFIKLHREQAIATTFLFVGFILVAMVLFVIFGTQSGENGETVREIQAAGSEIVSALAGLQ